MDPSNPDGSGGKSGEEAWSELTCSACEERLFGKVIVITMDDEFVSEEAKEQPHIMAMGEATNGELKYSFPMHPTHFEEFIQEAFKMEGTLMFVAVICEVGEVLSNVRSMPGGD